MQGLQKPSKRPQASGPSAKDGRQHRGCRSAPPFEWMSHRCCRSGATSGCRCVNPQQSLTTQKRSSRRVTAARSPSRRPRFVEHVWTCGGVLNTQRSFGDPDVWGQSWSNEGVNDLTTGCTFLLMVTPGDRL